MQEQQDNINQEPAKAGQKQLSTKETGQKPKVYLPVPLEILGDLFDYLCRDEVPKCRRSFEQTQAFLKERGIDEEPVLAWLNYHGAICDCNAVLNVLANVLDLYSA